jgi:hypothetical protein
VSTELGEFAVVPMTWRRERPASLRLGLADCLLAALVALWAKGVVRKAQGPALILGLVGVRLRAIVHGSGTALEKMSSHRSQKAIEAECSEGGEVDSARRGAASGISELTTGN